MLREKLQNSKRAKANEKIKYEKNHLHRFRGNACVVLRIENKAKKYEIHLSREQESE